MSKTLQWVIGIGVLLVVVAVVFSSVASIFLARAGLAGAAPFIGPGRVFGPRLPFMPGYLFGYGRLGARLPLLGLFGLARCLWPLLLAGLIVWAISQFTRRPAALPPVPAAASPDAPAVSAVPAVMANPAACSHCGQPLQAGWRHCPNCGTAVG
jgi:hypothetical protein